VTIGPSAFNKFGLVWFGILINKRSVKILGNSFQKALRPKVGKTHRGKVKFLSSLHHGYMAWFFPLPLCSQRLRIWPVLLLTITICCYFLQLLHHFIWTWFYYLSQRSSCCKYCNQKMGYLGTTNCQKMFTIAKVTMVRPYGSFTWTQYLDTVILQCFHVNPVTVFLQLVKSYCKPHLLYAVECVEFSHTVIKHLQSAWMCALSNIFHIKGSDLDYVGIMCNITPHEVETASRWRKFHRKLFDLAGETAVGVYFILYLLECSYCNFTCFFLCLFVLLHNNIKLMCITCLNVDKFCSIRPCCEPESGRSLWFCTHNKQHILFTCVLLK